jgi:hypothetical protein
MMVVMVVVIDQGSVNLKDDGKNLIIRRHHHLITLQRRQASRS